MIDSIRTVIAGDAPVFLLIAGPNGAGKSTFRERRLEPLGFPCIDPDAIGIEIYGRHPATSEEAVRATAEATWRVREHFREGRSVGLETVFSDSKGYKLTLIQEALVAGFRVVLVFIGVDHPQISIARVMDRVEHGGHDVPDEIIEDRFPRCFDNLAAALRLADLTMLVDNSGCYGPAVEAPDALRHYVFGIVDSGGQAQLSNPVPRWFVEFGVAEALSPSGASKFSN